MPELQGFPYFEVQFDKQGEIFANDEVDAVLDAVESNSISDLVILCHGWKNDIQDATNLYTELVGNIDGVLHAGNGVDLNDRTLGFVGVFWPSKKFTPIDLQPGGGASLGGAVTDAMLAAELDNLEELSDAADAADLITQAKALVSGLEDRKTAQDEFVDLVRRILVDQDPDAEVDAEMPKGLDQEEGREIIDRLSRPGSGESRSASGGAAGLGSFFSGIKGGAMNFLNMTTYWKMKKRAGKVGQKGLYQVLGKIAQRHPDLATHLVGHSFGGRVVSAAARGPDGEPAAKVETMALLQAAFSHNGFAQNFDDGRDGYFRRVITEHSVAGPILITHTGNDKAVGMAYPLASRVNRDDAAAFGDENDRFGGIGRNGAQSTPEAIFEDMQGESGHYSFAAHKLYNLKADAFIADHGDVRNRAVANMIVHGIASI